MLLNIERWSPGGDCVGHADGQVVFVAGALPGETVEADIVEGKKDFLRAVVREVVAPSPHRVAPRCQALRGMTPCGGCDFQHCDYPHQVTLKNELLAELFQRVGFSRPPLLEPVAGEPWGYRSRFQFHRDAKTGAIGFQAARSNAIVPIDDCLVAVPEIRELIRRKEVQGTRGTGQGGLTARFTVVVPHNCMVNLLGKTFAFSNECFFQSNLPLLERLIPAALGGLSGEQVLDLYSGVGGLRPFSG
jgi:23S rRNA (uracil1939-C5)-methyltransferase